MPARFHSQTAQLAAPIIFKIPRETAGIIARFSTRFAMDIWGGIVGPTARSGVH